MKTFFSLKPSIVVGVGFALCCGGIHSVWGVTAGGSPEASTGPVFTVSPVVSYAVVRLAKDNPNEPQLIPLKVTNSGRVLLSLSNSTYTDGAVVGGRWYQGVFSDLNGPNPPFTNYTELIEKSVFVSDMNDLGNVVGYSGNVYGPEPFFNDSYGLLWPVGDSAPTRMANEVTSPHVKHDGTQRDWQLIPNFIGLDGSIYGDFLNIGIEWFDDIGLSTLIQFSDGVKWANSSTDPDRLGSGFNSFDENSFSLSRKVVAWSSGGQLIYEVIAALGWGIGSDSHYEVSGRSFPSNGSSVFTPRGVNDSGRFVGHNFDSSTYENLVFWGEPVGELNHLSDGIVWSINNSNAILTESPEGLSRLWRWEPAGGGLHAYKAYGTTGGDKYNMVYVRSLNDLGCLLGAVKQVIDDAGTEIPVGLQKTVPGLLVPAELAVDFNHDGQIKLAHESGTTAESDLTSKAKPFRFAANDDDDDLVLGAGMDYTDAHVNGAEDLKDFFPVFLDIKQLLNVLPHTSGAVYKLKHEDGALNFVYTSLTRQTAFQYRTDGDDSTGYGAGGSLPATYAPTIQITADGVELGTDFLNRVKDQDQGVILVEMRNNSHLVTLPQTSGRVTKPLRLVVEKDGVVIAEIAVHLKSLEVASRKKGEAVPDNGVLVKTGGIIEVALDEDYFDKPNEQQSRINWQLRQRKADGTFDAWADFGPHGKGTRFEHTMQAGGIYQIRALYNGTDEVLYKRNKSERLDLFIPYGFGRKSAPESIGVCDTDIQIAVCREAQGFYASTVYAAEYAVPPQYGFAGYDASGGSIIRCNIFVAHRAVAAGAAVPAINGISNPYPPLANEWAGTEDTSIWPGDPTYIEGWPIMPQNTRPQPGWIIAHPKQGDAGHCAITDYDGEGIGAGTSGTVNKRYEDFFDGTSRLRRYAP